MARVRPHAAPASAALTVALFVLAAARGSAASDLVGAASCRTCHQEAYRVWSQTAHARAAQTLTAEQRKDPLCLQCHSRDEARAGQADVTGVSCETCHGGGRFYQPAVVMRDKELSQLFGLVARPSEASCRVCHAGQTASLQPFDLKQALERIDHWTAERAARANRDRPKDAARYHAPPQTLLAGWLRAKPAVAKDAK
jgi:cytochrome c5